VVPHLISGQYNLLACFLRALHLDVKKGAGRPVTATEVVAEVQVPDAFDVPVGAECPLRRVLGELLDGGADCLIELVVSFALAGALCNARGPSLGASSGVGSADGGSCGC
jgi:hypothetical protein